MSLTNSASKMLVAVLIVTFFAFESVHPLFCRTYSSAPTRTTAPTIEISNTTFGLSPSDLKAAIILILGLRYVFFLFSDAET